MSSPTGVPARYDTQPVSGSHRRSPARRSTLNPEARPFDPAQRVTSSTRSLAGSEAPYAFRSTNQAPVPSFIGSYGSRPVTTTHESARYADELYENYFIGSTKVPKNQNEILDPKVVSKIEKEESDKEYRNKLAEAIKEALGTKKKAHIYKDNLPTRQYSGVLQQRSNSKMPKNFFTTTEVNAYRTGRM